MRISLHHLRAIIKEEVARLREGSPYYPDDFDPSELDDEPTPARGQIDPDDDNFDPADLERDHLVDPEDQEVEWEPKNNKYY